MLAVALLVAVLLPLVLRTGVVARHEAQFEQFDLNQVQGFRQSVTRGGERLGGQSGVTTADVRTTPGLISGSAEGAAHLLLAPFPWQLARGSLRMQLTLPELLFWWWLFFAGVIPGLSYAIRNRWRELSA